MIFLVDFSVIKPDPGLLFWTVVIFSLFWFIMSKVAFKPIANGLKQRELDIQGALDEAKRARQEMSNLQAENERLLAQAREERTAMLKEAKETQDQIIAEARERANEEYRRRVESALRDIENQKMAALVELKNQSGKMAIEIAEKLLRKQFSNPAEQEAFAKSLTDEIKLN